MDIAPSDKLMNARCRLYTREPFYGSIAMSVNWVPSEMSWLPEKARTMGVCIKQGGDVTCVYYPPFVERLSIKELFAVVQHELEHLVRLHCLRVGSRIPPVWNIACCKPDELIIGGRNTAISELRAGDKVYGSNGREVEIVAPMQRHHSGKMIRLKGRYLLPFSVTPEHPVYVAPWKLKTTNQPKTTIKIYEEPRFIEAGKLVGCSGVYGRPGRSGYALVLPKFELTGSPETVDLRPYIERPGDGSIRTEELILNPDMGWLMGLYVAEGSPVSADLTAGIHFTLSAEEVEFAEEIQRILGEYGFSPSYEVDGSVCDVRVSSPILARAFADWFGRGAKNKRLPDWLLHHADQAFIRSVLCGYFAGDGHNSVRKQTYSLRGKEFECDRHTNSCGTTSRALALQLQLLGFTHGIPLSAYKSDRPERILNEKVLPPETLYCMSSGSWQARELFGQSVNRQRFYYKDAGRHVYLPLLEVDEEDYDGPVCNVETTDHTYLVSNAIVHNCDMVVNGRRSSPRIGYQEPATNEVIIPMKSEICWLPDDWPQEASAEECYSRLEKHVQSMHICAGCGRPVPQPGQGKGQKGSGKGKDKQKSKGGGGSGGSGEEQQEGKGEGSGGSSGQCPQCGQDDDGYYECGPFRGESLDDHSVWNMSDVSQDEARQIVKDIVDQAVEKSQGHVPGHLQEAIKALAKPVVRWRELLRRYLGKHVGNQRRTYSRANRRNDAFGFPGISHHAAATVNAIIDTSGSVGQKEFQAFFAELESIVGRAKLYILQWDHAFQGYGRYRKNDWKKFKVAGRGGTDMCAPVQWLIDNKRVADCTVMLSDGYANWIEPEKVKFPFITVLTTPEGTTEGPGYGQVVRLKPD